EYRKYKEIAYELKDKELNDKQVYTRSPIVFKDILNEPQVTKGNISIFEMVSALETVFLRHKWHQPLETKVGRKEISIQDSIKHNEIKCLQDEHFSEIKVSLLEEST